MLRKLKLLNSHSLLIKGLGLPPPRQTELSIGPPTIKIQASLLFEKKSTTLYGLKREIYNGICFSTELAKIYAKYSVRRLIN